ncbi:MAG: flagellar motor switch protein FliM [Phycisphaerales bacterium]
MAEAFNESDLTALLSAVEAGGLSDDADEVQIFSRTRQAFDHVEIREYDFKRPERISTDQIRALQTLHDAFGRSFGAALTGFLRAIVEVTVSSVEQMPYAEFVEGLPNPTGFCLVQPGELDGQMCLEVSPLIIYPILDRLMGGSSQELFIPQRAMTVIEARLILQILERAMISLHDAWEGVADITFSLGELESNPQLVQIVPPNEVVVVIRFELRMGKRAGTMSLCIPFTVIEPLVSRLDSQSWSTAGKRRDDATWEQMLAKRLNDAGLLLTATLAETSMTVGELAALDVGDIITTDAVAADPMLISIESVPKYFATVGRFKDQRAMKIMRPLTEADRAVRH